MPYVSVWPAGDLDFALELARTTDLRPALALAASDLDALRREAREALVAALRSRRAEVATRGLVPLPLAAPEEAWRMSLSLGQRAFWETLGRMPTVAFGIPYPSLLVEAHVDVALLEGPASELFLLKGRMVVPCLQVAPSWPSEVPAERRAVAGFRGFPRADAAEWISLHGPGLPPSELARFVPALSRAAPEPDATALPEPHPATREEWEALLRSLSTGSCGSTCPSEGGGPGPGPATGPAWRPRSRP